MIDAGIFGEDDRVELVEGFIVAMSPQDPSHAWAVSALTATLSRQLPAALRLRVQLPLTLATSEPEPDLAVVPFDEERSAPRHPRTAVLVIEVARDSLDRDRALKSATYAAAGVPEYWIVNILDRCVEVRLDPDEAGYARHARAEIGATLASAALAGVEVAVAELFRD